MSKIALRPCHFALVLSTEPLFVFFKQKTAYEMRISDWSSDVCSSDLHERNRCEVHLFYLLSSSGRRAVAEDRAALAHIIHEWRDRKSVVKGKSVSVRVDLGGRRIIKKKNKPIQPEINSITRNELAEKSAFSNNRL